MKNSEIIGISVGLILFFLGLVIVGISFLAIGWLIPILFGFLLYIVTDGFQDCEKEHASPVPNKQSGNEQK